jgi:hypothetical protein
MDTAGRMVRTYSDITKLDLSGLKSGVYMLNITTTDGKTTSTKVVKE